MKINFLKSIWLVVSLFIFIYPVQGNAAWNPKQKLPVSVQRLLLQVRKSMNQKDYPGAIERITAFHAQGRAASDQTSEITACRHPMVCFALGNCYLLKLDYQKAKIAYLNALEEAPDFIDAQINLARAYSETQNYHEAAKCFLKAYNGSDPKKPDYLYYSAVTYLMDKQAEQAITLFEKLFQAYPTVVECQWQENYVNALILADRMKQAIPVILQLVGKKQGKEKIRWQETLLQIYLQMNNTQQALAYATHLARTNCHVPRWWKTLVHIHLSLEQYEHALSHLIIYRYLTPLSIQEKKLWADLYLQLAIPDKAAHAYELVLIERSNVKQNQKFGQTSNKEILKRLVSACQQLDMPEKALTFLDRFNAKDSDPELLMLKGDLLYTMERFNDADEVYRLAAQNNFQQAGQAWLMAGYASWQQNDLSASREAFKHAAKFKRHRKNAMSAMAQLKKKK